MSTLQLPYDNTEDVKLNPNEYVTNATVNRPLVRLFENDVYLLSLIQGLSAEFLDLANQLRSEMLSLSADLIGDLNDFETAINDELDTVLPVLENGVIPIGASILWPLTTNCPAHFSFDDGTALSGTSFPTLSTLIASTYGNPTPTTFSKPNYGTIWNTASISNSLYSTAYVHGDDNNTYASVATEASYLHLQAKVWGSDGDGGDNAAAGIGIATKITNGNRLHIDYCYTTSRTLGGSYFTSTQYGIYATSTNPATTYDSHVFGQRMHFGTPTYPMTANDLLLEHCSSTNSGVWQSFTSAPLYGSYYHMIAIGFAATPHMVNLTLNLYISNISVYSSSGDLLLTIYSPAVAAAYSTQLKTWTSKTYGADDGFSWTSPPVYVMASNYIGTSSIYAIRTE